MIIRNFTGFGVILKLGSSKELNIPSEGRAFVRRCKGSDKLVFGDDTINIMYFECDGKNITNLPEEAPDQIILVDQKVAIAMRHERNDLYSLMSPYNREEEDPDVLCCARLAKFK